MKKLIIIAGPTASGKTAVAVALAKQINGEVISADSMQIYKGMDIGTAKPTMAECDGVPHHMIDIVTPDIAYSAALYQQQARAAINDVISRGKIPILCGGTGFYINAVLYDINFAVAEDENPRQIFKAIAATQDPAQLHAQLQAQDPSAAEVIHPNNVKRVVRALSYIHATGQLFSQYNAAQKKQPLVYEAVFCCLGVGRPALYQRINSRVLAMFEAGLEDEVAGLLAQGYHTGLVSMQGIGYKETAQYINGCCTRPEVIDLIQQNSRHYAKRQETWFRHQAPQAQIISAEERLPSEIAKEIAEKSINSF